MNKILFFIFFTVFSLSNVLMAYAENLIPYNDGKGKWGYCDDKSKIRIKPQFDYAMPFRNGVGTALKNQYTVFLSTDGTELFRGKWQNSGIPDGKGIPVQLRGYWGYAKLDGELTIPAEYEEFYAFSGNYAPAKKDGKWGLINFNTKGFEPCSCDMIMPFSEGFAVFVQNGKYGIFDSNGKTSAPPVYEELYPFSQGFATARLNGKYGFIDKDLFFKERNFIRIWPFSGGLAAASSLDSENKCGYVDAKGKIKIPFIYESCLPFSDGYAAVKKEPGGKWGFIDSKGKETSGFRFDKAYPFENGASWTIINEKGAWVSPEGRPYDRFFNLKKILDEREKR